MIQLYTGDGKGKTTAALGLALRAVGAGMQVFIGQFMKSGAFSECNALQVFGDAVTVVQYGSGEFVRGTPPQEEIARAEYGLDASEQAMISGLYGLVVLDEAVTAVSCGLLDEGRVLAFLDRCPGDVELVLTGRNAPDSLLERADLATEMRKIKHYFDRGVTARNGIER